MGVTMAAMAMRKRIRGLAQMTRLTHRGTFWQAVWSDLGNIGQSELLRALPMTDQVRPQCLSESNETKRFTRVFGTMSWTTATAVAVAPETNLWEAWLASTFWSSSGTLQRVLVRGISVKRETKALPKFEVVHLATFFVTCDNARLILCCESKISSYSQKR